MLIFENPDSTPCKPVSFWAYKQTAQFCTFPNSLPEADGQGWLLLSPPPIKSANYLNSEL